MRAEGAGRKRIQVRHRFGLDRDANATAAKAIGHAKAVALAVLKISRTAEDISREICISLACSPRLIRRHDRRPISATQKRARERA